MARREVIEITCDRCKRTETQNKREVSPEDEDELEVTFGGSTTKYADMCRRCRGTVSNYVARIRGEKRDVEAPENGKMPVGKKKGLPAPDFSEPPLPNSVKVK